MAKMREAHWIKRTHVFDPDEYECSACGRRFRQPAPSFKEDVLYQTA